MKKIFVVASLSTLLLSSMIDGAHDMTAGSATDESELCVYCHQTTIYTDQNLTVPQYNQDATVDPLFIDTTVSCLGCHDGVIASNQHPYSANLDYNKINADSGHPVFQTYNEQVYNLRPLNTTIYNWDNANKINDLLTDGKMQCISCHNPHNNQWENFLRHTNEQAQICNTCHVMS